MPGPAAGDDDALDRLERALAAVSRALAARHTRDDLARRSGHHLPPASWTLLEFLDDLGPLRVSAVAECQGVDVSTVTPRLQALERAGLVERRTVEFDGRVSMISRVVPPVELELGSAPILRISIFMSVFDCHVNRAPIGGTLDEGCLSVFEKEFGHRFGGVRPGVGDDLLEEVLGRFGLGLGGARDPPDERGGHTAVALDGTGGDGSG